MENIGGGGGGEEEENEETWVVLLVVKCEGELNNPKPIASKSPDIAWDRLCLWPLLLKFGVKWFGFGFGKDDMLY